MTPFELAASTHSLCTALLVMAGIILLVVVGTFIATLVHEHREQAQRIARRQIIFTAEQDLRNNTQATLHAMRNTIRDHLGRRG